MFMNYMDYTTGNMGFTTDHTYYITSNMDYGIGIRCGHEEHDESCLDGFELPSERVKYREGAYCPVQFRHMLENNCFLPLEDEKELYKTVRRDGRLYLFDMPLAFPTTPLIKLWRCKRVTYEQVMAEVKATGAGHVLCKEMLERSPQARSIVARYHLSQREGPRFLTVDREIQEAMLEEAFHFGEDWSFEDFLNESRHWKDWMFRHHVPFDPPHNCTWRKVCQEFDALEKALSVLPDADVAQTVLEFCSMHMARD